MGLDFLVPAFLAGLAALGIPVFYHLRQREQTRPFRFPSLMFLRRLPIRTSERRRITDWLLLLLRAGAVALLVVAFARPFVGGTTVTTVPQSARAMLLLLDRSLSMGHRDVWPAALDSARRRLATLGPEDRSAVILFDEAAEVAQPATTDRALALAAVNAARPSSRGTRYAAAFRTARQLAADLRGLRTEVVVVTDMQRSGLVGLAGLELPADLDVVPVPVVPVRRPDAAVVGGEVQRVAEGDRSRLLVSARLMTRDRGGPRTTRATLVVNGRPGGSRDVSLLADGAVSVGFDPIPLAAGPTRGFIALEGDELAADDTLRFALPPEAALRVILAAPADAGGSETLFLERALGIGRAPRFAVERRNPATLSEATLAGAAAVILYDTPVPGGTAGAALQRWTDRGGGTIAAAGRRLAARGLVGGGMIPGGVRGMADRMDDRGGSFGEVSVDHPVFSAFARDGAAALGAARFMRYPRATPDSGALVLARFDDGSPLLMERRVGEGRGLLLAAPLDATAGDFPLQPAFLPFLRRLLLHASGYDTPMPWRVAGESVRLPERLQRPVVSAPDGELLRPAGDSTGRAVVLQEAGFYDIYEGQAVGDPVATLAVNPPAEEADLTPADPRELLLGVRRGDSTTAAAATPPAPAEREGKQRLWRYLLLGAMALLLLEMIHANRGWRGTASPILPEAPERGAS